MGHSSRTVLSNSRGTAEQQKAQMLRTASGVQLQETVFVEQYVGLQLLIVSQNFGKCKNRSIAQIKVSMVSKVLSDLQTGLYTYILILMT